MRSDLLLRSCSKRRILHLNKPSNAGIPARVPESQAGMPELLLHTNINLTILPHLFRRDLITFLLLALSVLTTSLHATSVKLPSDFKVEPVTYGGAGGGVSRAEAQFLQNYPVIMIPDIGRDYRDWTGNNTGNASLLGSGNVYNKFIRAGFNPIELWMINFARAGEQMSSIEEATDDLKFYICSVLKYT